jgi:hypothetical protein
MKALISPNELRESGYRVAQTEQDDNIFSVQEPLFWTDCPNDILADYFWFDPTDNSFQPLAVPFFNITNDGKLVTAITRETNFLKTGYTIQMINQLPNDYSGSYIITVIDDKTFSFELKNDPSSSIINFGTYTINI